MKKICLLLTIYALSGCFGSEPQKTGKEGKPLPEFSILLTDSTTWFNTRNIHSGKPTVLFYLNPYCPFCKAQTKQIVDGMDRLKDIQFYFITSFPVKDIKGFYQDYQLAKYSNIVVGVDTAHFVSDYFEVTGVPYMAIYGKDKKLNNTFMGKVYNSQIKKVAEE